MDYLQTLFGFFNAPLFATFILGMFWKRMTPTAGWTGLVSGTGAAVLVGVLSKDALGPMSVGAIGLQGQGASFAAAGAAFVVDIVVSVLVSLVTAPKPESQLRGLVYSLTPRSDFHDPNESSLSWWQKPKQLAAVSAVLVIALNIIFW
jgi:SSS family solute:Na+ symporter